MVLAVPRLLTVTHLRFIFKDNNLFTFSFTLRGSHNSRPGNGGRAYGKLIAIGDEQHFIQLNGSTRLNTQALDIDRLPGSDFILLATGFNNSVNFATS